MSKQKQRALTLSEKIIILDKCKARPAGMNQRELADHLQLPRSTLQKLIANEANLREEATLGKKNLHLVKKKRNRKGKDAEVEEALLLWFQQAVAKNVSITGPILKEKAETLALKLGKMDFKPTDGWLGRWKARNDVIFKRAYRSADGQGAQSWTSTVIPLLLLTYDPNDIYNADETGLYYRATPDGTLVFRRTALKGCKKAMDRLTILVCANMTGSDRQKLLVIGKSKQPRCLKHVKMETLPVSYANNRSAWMTSSIFLNWVHDWDRALAQQNRHILLLIDNAPSHPHATDLKFIRLEFLPGNATSLIQPMDQGIIKNLKHHYRRHLSERLVNYLDANIINANSTVADVSRQITILDAMLMLANAWEAVKETTISNCFRKAGFGPKVVSNEDPEALPEDEMQPEDHEYGDFDKGLQCHEAQTDDETVIAETVASKRSRVHEDVESDSSSDDEELPTAKPSEILKGLHETEQLLVRHGQFHLIGNLTQIVHAVKVVQNAYLHEQDIRDFV